jgi:hypothetical protein
LRYLAVLQSFCAQVQATLIVLRERLEDSAQLLLRLAERKLFFRVVTGVRMLGQNLLSIPVPCNCLVCRSPL